MGKRLRPTFVPPAVMDFDCRETHSTAEFANDCVNVVAIARSSRHTNAVAGLFAPVWCMARRDASTEGLLNHARLAATSSAQPAVGVSQYQ